MSAGKVAKQLSLPKSSLDNSVLAVSESGYHARRKRS